MKIKIWTAELILANPWAIASDVKNGTAAGRKSGVVYLVELTDQTGLKGLGEASPPARYKESPATANEFLHKVDASKLSFDDIPGSMAYLETIAPGNYSAKNAINIALVDAVAKRAGKPVYDWLGL